MPQSQIDIFWVLTSCVLVFLMQCGFLSLESGMSRAKNNINVAIKNLTDFTLSVTVFWLIGSFLIFQRPFDLTANEASFLLFHSLFCGTATTIVSGAVAERMGFPTYLIGSLVLSGFIYVVICQWVWGGALDPAHSGWLEARGFVDFAGSSVVHMTGAFVALGFLLRLGPRNGRYDANGRLRLIPGADMTSAMQGVFLIWIGWLGFNGGSYLGFHEDVPHVLIKTILGGAAGVVGATAVGWSVFKIPRAEYMITGAIAGLVSITAGVHALGYFDILLISALGGIFALFFEEFQIRKHIDDVICAVPAHGIGGLWGVLAVGLFADTSVLGTGLTRIDQIVIQLIGALSIMAFAFSAGLLLALALEKTIGLRVSAEAEHAGLNWSEHRVTTAINELYHDMSHLYISKDFRHRIRSEPNTVAGDIANVFNRILERFQQEQDRATILRSKAEAAAEAKSNFLATMSHEIRTPMNGILGMVEMMRESDLSEEQSDFLNTIHDSGEALLTIINDVLDYSRIEAGQMLYERIEFNLTVLCNQIIQLFSYLAKEKGIGLKLKQGEFKPIRIGDPNRLRQVLTNLVGNAIKFTETGGVVLSVTEQNNGKISFLVQDTGIGIAQAQIDNLFNEFTQADNTISRRYGGTGLGLAICKNLVSGMSGSLYVESQLGEGSMFGFSLPLEEAMREEAQVKVTQLDVDHLIESIQGQTVLVVDDNVVNRTVAKKMLQCFKLNVDEAESGKNCLEKMKNNHYDLILMDMHMPDLDGIETTKLIRENPAYLTLPIIALTANTLPEVKESWEEAGVTDYLTKPLRKAEITNALIRVAQIKLENKKAS